MKTKTRRAISVWLAALFTALQLVTATGLPLVTPAACCCCPPGAESCCCKRSGKPGAQRGPEWKGAMRCSKGCGCMDNAVFSPQLPVAAPAGRVFAALVSARFVPIVRSARSAHSEIPSLYQRPPPSA